MAFITSSLLIYFLLKINHHSEKTLHLSQENLRETAVELKKSKQRFELAIHGSNAGIWEWDITNNCIYNSPRWKVMLGYSISELETMTLETFVEKILMVDRARVQLALQNHLEKRTPYNIEFRMVKKNNSIIWVKDSGVAVFDDTGNAVLMAGSIIDITERKEIQKKIIHQNELLVKANLELDRFVYSASHDLRSPLSSILGLINIAKKTNEPKEIGTCLELMKAQISTLDNFITEIQDYSQNSRKIVKHETIELHSFTDEIIKSLMFSEKANQLKFVCDIPAELPLKTDKGRLRIVLSNLIGNSIKYSDLTKDKAFVSIKSGIEKGHHYIVIEDNGLGIGEEHHSKIFDMFYRASESSKGSGLGLYIVKETLLKLGGTISFQSTLGSGSTFEIKLPK